MRRDRRGLFGLGDRNYRGSLPSGREVAHPLKVIEDVGEKNQSFLGEMS